MTQQISRRSLVNGALGGLVLGFTVSEGSRATDLLGQPGAAGPATRTGPAGASNTR